MRIIAVANSKGGSGKTATVFNLGSELARRGAKVLLWDLDPQASLTSCFKTTFPQDQIYSEDVIASEKLNPLASPVEVSKDLFLLPATSALGGYEGVLAQGDNILRPKRILERLAAMNFDFVILDPPGSTDIFMSAALAAAQEVIIPVRPTDTDFTTMVDFKNTLDRIKAINPDLRVRGILFNQVITSSKNQKIYKGFLEQAEWSDLVCSASIRMATSVANAPGVGKDVIDFDPRSKAAADYKTLANEVLSWN